jgi:predicted phage baseplate assembly protein
VPDFYGSKGRDRHYVLDHLTGEVRFGDGLSGLIPPPGVGNLRLTRYRTGGGVQGNLPAGAIAQLAITLPYIDSVVNREPAAGGADAESLEALRERAPRLLRHGGRAVSRDDYEDLAIQASPEVARAHCVPLWDRSSVEVFNPPATQPKGGHVTVVLLPRSDSPKPLPSMELVGRVQAYLDARRLPDVKLHVVGPDYLSVTVTAAVVAVSIEAASRLDVKEVLARFLHPLTGGVDGRGWPWGRKPHLSSLYRCIEAIPGVDHVQTLTVKEGEEPRNLSETSYFLVSSGAHKVTVLPPQ